MAEINKLAKDMGIKLPPYATKPIKDMINKYKKNNKWIKGDVSDDLKKKAIKKHMNRLTKKPHAEEYPSAISGALGRGASKKEGIGGLNISYKKGGTVKKYATGGSVSRGQYPAQARKVKFKGVF